MQETTMRAALAVVLFTIFCAPAGARASDAREAATADSQDLVKLLEAEWAEDTSDYVKLFLGKIYCQYDFTEEKTFNDIADQALIKIGATARAFLASRENDLFEKIPEEGQEYVSITIALVSIGLLSNYLSADHAKPARCPPMPSATRKRPRSGSRAKRSSLAWRRCQRPKAPLSRTAWNSPEKIIGEAAQ